MNSASLQKQLDETWTVQDVCDEYGVTGMTVHLWRTDRKPPMPAVVIAGRSRPAVRFVPAEVKKWAKGEGILTLAERRAPAVAATA